MTNLKCFVYSFIIVFVGLFILNENTYSNNVIAQYLDDNNQIIYIGSNVTIDDLDLLNKDRAKENNLALMVESGGSHANM